MGAVRWWLGSLDFAQLETSGTDTEDTKAQLASVTAAQFWIKLMHKNDYGYPRGGREDGGWGRQRMDALERFCEAHVGGGCTALHFLFFFRFVFVLVKN